MRAINASMRKRERDHGEAGDKSRQYAQALKKTKVFTSAEMSTASGGAWNQLIRLLEMELRPRRHLRRMVRLNQSMLAFITSIVATLSASVAHLCPYIPPPSPSLCYDFVLCPFDLSHPPLEVDELIHQQKRAGQVGDAGFWSATVAVRVTTWKRARKKERKKETEMGMEEPWEIVRNKQMKKRSLTRGCMEKIRRNEEIRMKGGGGVCMNRDRKREEAENKLGSCLNSCINIGRK